MTIHLLPIDESGTPPLDASPQMVLDNCGFMAAFFLVVGFDPPWIGYVTVSDGEPVGGGAFKGAPCDNRVEIAYYTLPGREGRGFATATARELARIARRQQPGVIVAAQTLPMRSASTALLGKLGFAHVATVQHPEDGKVWEWQLDPALPVP